MITRTIANNRIVKLSFGTEVKQKQQKLWFITLRSSGIRGCSWLTCEQSHNAVLDRKLISFLVNNLGLTNFRVHCDLSRKRRLDLIQDLRWTHGSLPEHVRDNLTPQELHFFKEYSKLLNKYMRSPDMGGVGLDLTAVRYFFFFDLTPCLSPYFKQNFLHRINTCRFLQDPVPPDDPYVQVRVVKDYGEVTFSSGTVKLKKGQSHWLLRDEAHPLLMDEVLECVS